MSVSQKRFAWLVVSLWCLVLMVPTIYALENNCYWMVVLGIGFMISVVPFVLVIVLTLSSKQEEWQKVWSSLQYTFPLVAMGIILLVINCCRFVSPQKVYIGEPWHLIFNQHGRHVIGEWGGQIRILSECVPVSQAKYFSFDYYKYQFVNADIVVMIKISQGHFYFPPEKRAVHHYYRQKRQDTIDHLVERKICSVAFIKLIKSTPKDKLKSIRRETVILEFDPFDAELIKHTGIVAISNQVVCKISVIPKTDLLPELKPGFRLPLPKFRKLPFEQQMI